MVWPGIAEAAASLFVAYIGYARLAILGEEVHNPKVTARLAATTREWISKRGVFCLLRMSSNIEYRSASLDQATNERHSGSELTFCSSLLAPAKD